MKILTCIECPKGCSLTVEKGPNGKLTVSGNQCPKGEAYAAAETENPARILTSAVLAHGLALKMVPVKTDRPIPKPRIMEAMEAVKLIRLTHAVEGGDVIAENFLGLGVCLIATRDCVAPGN